MVVFSNKAYNAVIRESFDKDPVETGGILLGHTLDNGVWIVMEVLPPGIRCIFEIAYFEYDDAFVNYLAQSVANQYKIPLELLGLWHRHPGSMDVFSSTDDGTNTTFAQQNPSGVISGLVNIDPKFRLTMYHMDNPRNVVRQHNRPNYERVEIEVGDDIIPEEYFQLKYYDGEDSNLNPFVERSHTRMSRSVRTDGTGQRHANEEPLDICNTIEDNLNRENSNSFEPQNENPSWINDYKKIWEILKKNKIVNLIALILVIASIFSIKTVIDYGKSATETVISWFDDDDEKEPIISATELTLNVGDSEILEAGNVMNKRKVTWRSSEEEVATVNEKGKVTAKKEGIAKVILLVDNKEIGKCNVEVKVKNENSNLSLLTLSETKRQLRVGQTFTLVVNGTEGNSEINWSSDNSDVATVDDKGGVTAVKEGTTNIVATIAGQSYDCVLTVEPQDKEVTGNNDVTIKIKSWKNTGTGSIPITKKDYCVLLEKSGPVVDELICFSSEDSSIATINSSSGQVTPVSVGVVKIIVSYIDQEQDTLLLTINQN